MKNIGDIIRNYQSITNCDRVLLSAKEAYYSATNYHDGKHYGALTDLTGIPALTNIYKKMIENPVGKTILMEKPRITDELLFSLAELPENTLGKHYYNFMTINGFKPSERPLVRYVPDLELAYVSQRYKEIHDFLHVLLLDVINVHNQLVIKWFQMIQLGLPSAALAVLASPFMSKNLTLAEVGEICRIASKHQFIMNIYYEKHLDRPLVDVKKELMSL